MFYRLLAEIAVCYMQDNIVFYNILLYNYRIKWIIMKQNGKQKHLVNII